MKLTFENATIQDAIGKAARVAPTRGSSFDKANGILITVQDGQVSVRATNLEIFYHEVVDTVEVEGEGEWRLASAILAGFMNKISVASGRTITLEDEGTAVVAQTGRMKAKFRMLPPQYFPQWEVFDPERLVSVSGFAERVQQVAWAADEKAVPLSGVHLTGTEVAATNRYRIATAPCAIPDLEQAITVPSSIFDPIMKNLGDVRLGVDGGHLLLMPDQYTQIKAVIFGEDYPKIVQATAGFTFDHEVKFKKSQIVEMIDMAQVFAGSNRHPKMRLIIGREEVAVMLDEKDHMMGDVIEVPGMAVHKRINLDFTPRSILEAINAAPSEEVILHYSPPSDAGRSRPVLIDGGSGYRAWVMPRREQTAEQEGGA